MSGRTPAAAVNNFQEPFRRALSCVTRPTPNTHGGYHVAVEPHALTLGTGDAVRLSSQDRIHLRFAHYYRIVEEHNSRHRWRVITTGYIYSLGDTNRQEILAFHWHPDRRSPITEPHLHLGPGARVGYDRLHRAHIPTGHITIQDVLLLAINDLGVEPLVDRETALQTLIDTRMQ